MPTVRGKGGGQVPHQGQHTDTEIKKMMHAAYPRDDINEAYAGEENSGPYSNEKEDHRHSRHKKSRKTKDPTRTPLR